MDAHNKLAIIIVDFLFLSHAAQDHLRGLRLGCRFPPLLLLSLEQEALSAHGHVSLGPAHQLHIIIRNRAERETRLVIAELTDGVELLNFFSLGHQVKDRVESFTLVGASEGADNHNLAVLGGIFAELDDLYTYQSKLSQAGSKQSTYIWVKLALVDAQHVVLHPQVAQLAELVHGSSRLFLPVENSSQVMSKNEIWSKKESIHQTEKIALLTEKWQQKAK